MKEFNLSVIIPTHNSEKSLTECLNSLISQSYPREKFEIIIVDDGSTDQTLEIVKKFKINEILQTRPCSISKARNIGVKNAHSEFLAFVDSDCEVDSKWVEVIVNELKSSQAITGPVLNGNEQSHVAWAEYFIEFGSCHERRKRSFVRFLPGCSSACTKEAFDKAGGYPDLRASEDVIFGQCLKKANVELVFIPQMKIKHLCRTDWNHVSSNMKLLGKYFVRTRKKVPSIKYSSLVRSRWQIPLIFFGRVFKSLINAKNSGKILKYVISFPYIIAAMISYCKGIWEEMSKNT